MDFGNHASFLIMEGKGKEKIERGYFFEEKREHLAGHFHFSGRSKYSIFNRRSDGGFILWETDAGIRRQY